MARGWTAARRVVQCAALAAGLALAACATTPVTPGGPSAGSPHGAPHGAPLGTSGVPAFQPASPPLGPRSGLAALPGWAQEDHRAALAAFQSGCGPARDYALQAACARARALGPVSDDGAARAFLEANFRAEPASGEGLLTAYFAPEYEARAAPDAAYSAPVRGRPADLFVADLGAFDPGMVGRRVTARLSEGALAPYPDRVAIETAPAPDALAWMRPEDLFFLQIQGSGVLSFPDGRRLKAVYAGDNGQPFVPIARPMIQAGQLAPNRASGDAIRAWLAAHHGPEADAVMRQNPRYVFFALAPDDGREPPGAAGVPLTAGRSIAVDPGRHAYGEPWWIEASAPTLAGAARTYRRFVVALDTGAAIRGEVRADLYIGRGAAAGDEAGRVRHTLRMVRLVPIPTAPAQAAAPPVAHPASIADALAAAASQPPHETPAAPR